MDYVEEFARKERLKEFLTLDTAALSPAKDMYRRLGWEEWGTCKDYASWTGVDVILRFSGRSCEATNECRMRQVEIDRPNDLNAILSLS